MTYLNTSFPREFPSRPYRRQSELDLKDVEAILLILKGDSIIDWHRLSFRDRGEVNDFLRVNQFDPDSPEDQRRFRYLHQEAIQYLSNHFNLRIPRPLLEPVDVQELFLHASFSERRLNRHQRLACVILKVMSILHHIEARSLLFRTPISDFELFSLVQDRVDGFYEAAQQAQVPLVQIFGSRKSRDSLITKLLSKRGTIAATIFDKLRFRIILESYDDILPVISFMMQTFLPFNYTIPNESINTLYDTGAYLASRPDLTAQMDGILSNYRPEQCLSESRHHNTFSGSTYRMINFIVDLPIRLDSFLSAEDILRYGRIAFVLIEFQIVDQATEEENERGENSHELYKQRQFDRVLERLRRGGGLKSRSQDRQPRGGSESGNGQGGNGP